MTDVSKMYLPEVIEEHVMRYVEQIIEEICGAFGLPHDDVTDARVGFFYGVAYSTCSPSRNPITGIPVEDDSVFAPRPVEVENANVA